MRYGFLASIIALLLSCQAPTDIKTSEETTQKEYYNEEHRPQFHFSPEANWMNDPNGMVYYEGEYHLFYQYYPDSTVWGPMHWGHAVSPDMVTWEHLPIALYPDSLGLIFSGSAVIDWNNTSGLGSQDQPPMIAIFTHHDMEGERNKTNTFQYQSIAYSTDRGRTFVKYEGNPVITNPGIKDFRDPKVIWHEDSQKWIMVFAAYDKVLIYNSPNLIDWNLASEFGIPNDTRLWECPDLFPIKIQGTDEEKWVLITSIQKDAPNGGTATSYFVGDFDGVRFIGDNKNQKWLDYGTDNYAMVTWSDVPQSDDRRLALGWMSNWQYAQQVPTEKWRSTMTLPRELTLHKSGEDYNLRSAPVAELNKISGKSTSIPRQVISGTLELNPNEKHSLYRLDLSFEKSSKGIIEVRFSNNSDESLSVGYSVDDQHYFIDRTFAGKDDFSDVFADYHTGDASYDHELVNMKIYLDLSSIELFADDGQCVMTDIFFPTDPYTKIEIVAENHDVTLLKSTITRLSSIW